MKTINIIVVFFLSVCLSSTAYDQKCKNFLKSRIFKMSNPGTFQSYGQSTNEEVAVRKTYKFEIVFAGKTEYKMGIATEADYEPVHIRMIDKNNKVLFDNKKYQYIESVDFYLEKTQTITLELTVLAVDELFVLPEDLRVCLGIKIYSQSID
jgi:hypothetical protein